MEECRSEGRHPAFHLISVVLDDPRSPTLMAEGTQLIGLRPLPVGVERPSQLGVRIGKERMCLTRIWLDLSGLLQIWQCIERFILQRQNSAP